MAMAVRETPSRRAKDKAKAKIEAYYHRQRRNPLLGEFVTVITCGHEWWDEWVRTLRINASVAAELRRRDCTVVSMAYRTHRFVISDSRTSALITVFENDQWMKELAEFARRARKSRIAVRGSGPRGVARGSGSG